MKKIVLVCSILISFYPSAAQFPFRPADTTDTSLPSWARMMYGANPNFLEVERAFEEYFKTHAGEENYHTAYYKHWRRMMKRFVQEDGTLRMPSQPERNDMKIQKQHLPSGRLSAPWNFVGPERNFRSRTNVNDTVIQISWHANMYCIDQSMSNTNVLYAGSENGGVYRSADKGLSWQYISHNEDMTTVTAIAVNPSSENDVLVNTDNQTYRSLDGGQTWNPITGVIQGKHVRQFTYNPANHFMVYAGTTAG